MVAYGFTYLGIMVNGNLKNLYKLNLAGLLQKVEGNLCKWMDLPLTLLGRINVIKMNVLPRFLYLFQSLPIPVPAAFFPSLDKLTRRFIWHGKTPRVGLDKLTLDYSQGGLNLPNFRMYYWAAQSRFLAQRFDNGPSPSWLNIEKLEVNDDTWAELFYKWDRKSIKTITDNPLIIHSVLAWCKLHELFGRGGFLSPKTPLWNNRLIPMFFQNSNFRPWSDKGITLLEHCYEEGVLMSFDQLKQKYHLPNRDFFSYLQLRNFIRVTLKGQWNLPKMSPIEQLCHADQPLFKTMSRVYDALMSGLTLPGLDKPRLRWGKDLGIDLDEDLWSDLCRDGVTSTLNSRYRLIQFNFLHQLYITPSRLHKFNPDISSLCFRCGSDEGTFLHSTWQCSKLHGFWQGVCDTISSIHRVVFPLDPEVCLLGNFTNTNLRQSHTIKLTEILLAIAKKCIALKWKLDSSLPVAMWLSEVNSCIPLEKITYCLRNKLKTFYRIWQPFIDYMENLPPHLID